ncbi:hypothetical protein G6F22_019003 [Rhizopus arrhizus]|nr:hypothetical protein G6F22_019003 [Rhizopus arrhizus]
MFKRLFLSVSVLAAALCIAPAACAQTPWPGAKPLTLIVPFSPGGNVDTTARLVAQKLAERLNQSIIVDNVAGAGGVLGRGPPDQFGREVRRREGPDAGGAGDDRAGRAAGPPWPAGEQHG